MRLDLTPPVDQPFLPLLDSPFPPLPPEYRAALRVQRELEGAISALSEHQATAQAQLVRKRDDLRAQGARITLARERKTLAEVQGADTSTADKELTAAERKRAQIEADIAQLERDIAARAQAVQARQAELSANQKVVFTVEKAYQHASLEAFIASDAIREQSLAIVRMWGAMDGYVNTNHPEWWLQKFCGASTLEFRNAYDEGRRQMAEFLANHPLTGEDDAG